MNQFRRLKALFFIWLRIIARKQAIWLRAVLCLGIGISFYLVDKNTDYGFRFFVRGSKIAHDKIVLLHISQSEWIDYHGKTRNVIRPLKEITALTDSFFWNEQTWNELLSFILRQDPKSIAVTFFFGEGIRRSGNNFDLGKPFDDDRILWSAALDSDGRVLFPPFSSTSQVSKIGLNGLKSDEDGVLRHFSAGFVQLPHLAYRLASRLKTVNSKIIQPNIILGENYVINFRARPGTYTSIRFQDVIENRVSTEFFKDKVVIISGNDTEGHSYQTPVGKLSRAEVFAELTANISDNLWIKQIPGMIIVAYLILILAISIWIQFTYPQSISLVLTIWLGTATTALSTWAFDSFYIWIPVLAVLIQLGTTYIVFLSYHLTVNENLNWRLEQEKIYLTEVEQMKHNFVSLFSHDLKTPIAKIQAICDRLLSGNFNPELKKDLMSLRRESDELHKYIKKILQISRVESSEFKLNFETSDINEIILEVIEQLNPLAKEKGIIIQTKLEPMFLIEIDSILIREVILNLVENAIKYSHQSGSVQIVSKEQNDHIVIEIHDNGMGISKEDQSRVFEKFVRGSEQEHLSKGTGLGLYLVKYFVELHGGTISLKSRKGHGTTVSFKLPFDESSGSQMLGLEIES